MKKKGKKNKKNVLVRYNEAQTKKNLKYSGMKTGVDLVGATIGAGAGALLGIWSPLLGVALFGAGHYFGDKSGVLRIVGAGAIAYGIAKAVENRDAVTEVSVNGADLGSLAEGAKDRLINFKNDWLKAFYIDKVISKKSDSEDESESEEEMTIGAVDMSALDVFQNQVDQSAVNFEIQKMTKEEASFQEEEELEDDEEEVEEVDYSIVEDQINFSDF